MFFNVYDCSSLLCFGIPDVIWFKFFKNIFALSVLVVMFFHHFSNDHEYTLFSNDYKYGSPVHFL